MRPALPVAGRGMGRLFRRASHRGARGRQRDEEGLPGGQRRRVWVCPRGGEGRFCEVSGEGPLQVDPGCSRRVVATPAKPALRVCS
jgi:hypothetical protein